ncbi:MAG: DNA repair protein RadA, partial [Candidatus Babeliales bacterium]
MSKQKIVFTCTNCNHCVPKWLGCCPLCNEWNSFTETITNSKKNNHTKSMQLVTLAEIDINKVTRIQTGIQEWDRVVGNGIVPGSLLILTGDPGIGKSTLLLQLASTLANNYTTIYFSTEESLAQVKQRANRLHCFSEQLFFSDRSELATIIATAEQYKPDLIIIDSIQNCYLENAQTQHGSISQLREATFQLMRLTKEKNITIILTGHITKEGFIAGPKTLEHLVDAVFYLQGEDQWQTRILRAVKNRFGPCNEIGFFTMSTTGLQETPNINEHLLSELSHSPGSALVSVMEGSRPLLLELQSLTIASKLVMPQRVISGLDHKQVVLIAAILEKQLKIKLSTHDIFFKISGGFKTKSSGTDLGIALALLSSYFQQPLPEKSLALGEISLTGQIKPINQINFFIHEAKKFSIKQIFLSKKQTIEKEIATIQRFQ